MAAPSAAKLGTATGTSVGSISASVTPTGGGVLVAAVVVGMNNGGVGNPAPAEATFSASGLGGTWTRLGGSSSWVTNVNRRQVVFISDDYDAGTDTLTMSWSDTATLTAKGSILTVDEVSDTSGRVQSTGEDLSNVVDLLVAPAASSLVWGGLHTGGRNFTPASTDVDAVDLGGAALSHGGRLTANGTAYRIGQQTINFEMGGATNDKGGYIIEFAAPGGWTVGSVAF